MTTIAVRRESAKKRIMILQWVTLCWMTVECSAALTAAWRARSVSLLAFGSDSFVEIVSAVAVLLQFAPRWRVSQIRAAKLCGLLLYALAGIVLLIALAGMYRHVEAETSRLGMAITGGALLLMPVLAHMKRNEADRTGNKALRADAVQSATCAYLAALTLAGLLLQALFGLHWLDQGAALIAVPILIVEGRRAREGRVCSCC
ncbi:cation transporter [Granulicella arctica]|uniref:cation transporter n=1 Tax=Granulicella arctica TaxID=940613 RepID=UPI0021E04C3A|nr:cation transporter [Granulicella arctica]